MIRMFGIFHLNVLRFFYYFSYSRVEYGSTVEECTAWMPGSGVTMEQVSQAVMDLVEVGELYSTIDDH